jgi:hypothetical protein
MVYPVVPGEPDVHATLTALHKAVHSVSIGPYHLLDLPVQNKNGDGLTSIEATPKKSLVIVVIAMGRAQSCWFFRVKRHFQSGGIYLSQSLYYQELYCDHR